jgi:DNA-binding ferritin-like protein (Dps family)
VILSTCIILAVDVVGILSLGLKFDTQLNITLFETLILSMILMILEFVELCRLKSYLGDDVKLDYEALVNQMNESMDKKLRQDMLKQINCISRQCVCG